MSFVTAFGGLALAAGLAHSAAPAPAPPARPAAWHQVGAAVSSRPGKLLYAYRSVDDPNDLAAVFESSSPTALRVSWFSYCEFSSDDDIMEEHQGTATGVGRVTVYAPVFNGATRCYLSAYARPVPSGKIVAAIFAS